MSRTHSVAAWAASGVVPLTGLPAGPPLCPPGAAALASRRLMQSFSALATALEATVRVDGAALLGERAAFTGARRAGALSVGGACRLLPAADGLLAVSLPRPDDALLAGALIGQEISGAPHDAIAGWARSRSAAETIALAVELGLAIAAAGERRYRPGTCAAADLVAAAAAGADLPGSAAPARRSRRPPSPPVVVDFSALWAGPLCAHLLGLAGATVIKVETHDRPDGARRGNRGFYDLLHSGHAAISVDPGNPEDAALLRDLIAAADIVLEASRPRALAGWGLSAEAAVAAGTTWVSITAYGRAGADAQRIGFGDDIAVAAGLIAVDPETGAAVFCGDALADPLTGLAGAVLALDAFLSRPGQLIDVSMADVVAATLDGAGTAAATRVDGEWLLPAADGFVRVQEPTARSAGVPAPEPGRDTSLIRTWLRSRG